MRFYLFFLLLVSAKLFATAQEPDVLIRNSVEYNLNSNPLEVFFEKYPGKRPKNYIQSSANWRGYIAYFELINNQLFVKDVVIEKIQDSDGNIKKVSVFEEIFTTKDKIRCDFYNGLLIVPHGETLQYVNIGYASLFQFYTVIEIQDGTLSKEKRFNHEEFVKFRQKLFYAFKKTERYKVLATNMIKAIDEDERYIEEKFPEKKGHKKNKYLVEAEKKWKRDKQIDNFLMLFVTDYITKFLNE